MFESIRNSDREYISTIFQIYKRLVVFYVRDLQVDGHIVNFSLLECMGGNVLFIMHVGLLYMWAYFTSGPTTHVGLLYMWD